MEAGEITFKRQNNPDDHEKNRVWAADLGSAVPS